MQQGSLVSSAAAPEVRARVRRVLLADDDDLLRELVASQLVRAGYEVYEADSGAEALACVRQSIEARLRLPDAIVLDVSMPHVSGMDVIAALRAEGVRLPVILVTGVVNDEHRIALLSGDVFALLEKPFSMEALEGALIAVAEAAT